MPYKPLGWFIWEPKENIIIAELRKRLLLNAFGKLPYINEVLQHILGNNWYQVYNTTIIYFQKMLSKHGVSSELQVLRYVDRKTAVFEYAVMEMKTDSPTYAYCTLYLYRNYKFIYYRIFFNSCS